VNSTQDAVLERLAAADRAFVSGEDLGRGLGISRAAIAKAVAGLREHGYEIESVSHRGHRLVARPGTLLPAEVQDGLRTRHLGRLIQYHDQAVTTQTIARTAADQDAPHGTLVIAESQSGGRGRLSRPYACPPGGIWCTLIIRPPVPPPLTPLFSLAAGVAVARAVRANIAGLPVLLKWPNDVLIRDRKVAGILTEMAGEEQTVHYLLVGAGINVNFAAEVLPPEVRPTATTMQTELGRPLDRRVILQAYLEHFERLYDAVCDGRGQEILAAWREFPNTIGRMVSASTWHGVVEGRAAGLDDDGALLLELADGRTERLTAAEIVHQPPLSAEPSQ
jgi:BirA family biotin operon repressor/biotin-[acetyl-CoA-carboxylase] ligase